MVSFNPVIYTQVGPIRVVHDIPVGPIRVIYDVSVSSVLTVHSTVTLFREGK